MPVQTDVVIIGAGPTGMTAAALLADLGLEVILIDKRDGPGDEPRAISITDESLRVMQRIGVLEGLRPDLLTDTGARYWGRNGQLLARVQPANPRLGLPAKSQFDQPALEARLLDAVRRRAGIDLRLSTEAGAVRTTENDVEVDVREAEGETTIRASWLIACDGGSSPVRTQLDIRMTGTTQVQKWIVIDITGSDPDPQRYADFYCNGRRPVVVVPGTRGRRRYEFMLLPGESATEMTTPEAISTLVSQFEPIDAGQIRRAAVYVAHQRVATRYRHDRVLLAGDAAHMMPPFAGQGLNAGIRDAANLAWKVAAQMRGRGTEALISSYDSERRPHAQQMVTLSGRIGKVVMTRNPLLTALRDGVISASALIPATHAWLTGMRFLKQPHFTRGCVIAPAPGIPRHEAAWVGRSLAQPSVSVEGGHPVPLDSLLGAGWAIIRLDGAGCSVVRLGSAESHAARFTDRDGTFAGAGLRPLSVIVRPDRYVAAVCETDDEQETLAALEEYILGLRNDY